MLSWSVYLCLCVSPWDVVFWCFLVVQCPASLFQGGHATGGIWKKSWETIQPPVQECANKVMNYEANCILQLTYLKNKTISIQKIVCVASLSMGEKYDQSYSIHSCLRVIWKMCKSICKLTLTNYLIILSSSTLQDPQASTHLEAASASSALMAAHSIQRNTGPRVCGGRALAASRAPGEEEWWAYDLSNDKGNRMESINGESYASGYN